MTSGRFVDLPNRTLFPLFSIVRQLARYEPYLPESFNAELTKFLAALHDADHHRWEDSPLLYRRIAAKVEARILAGEWQDLTPLPTGMLAHEYGVSTDCLRKAYRNLSERGLAAPLGHRRRWCVVHENRACAPHPKRKPQATAR